MGLRDVCVWVLPGLSHDIVLGMDFLAEHNPQVDFAHRSMRFSDAVAVANGSVV